MVGDDYPILFRNSKPPRKREKFTARYRQLTQNKFPIVRYSAVDVDLPQVDVQNQELLEDLERTFRKSAVVDLALNLFALECLVEISYHQPREECM